MKDRVSDLNLICVVAATLALAIGVKIVGCRARRHNRPKCSQSGFEGASGKSNAMVLLLIWKYAGSGSPNQMTPAAAA
jgi:hypothetical protein